MCASVWRSLSNENILSRLRAPTWKVHSRYDLRSVEEIRLQNIQFLDKRRGIFYCIMMGHAKIICMFFLHGPLYVGYSRVSSEKGLLGYLQWWKSKKNLFKESLRRLSNFFLEIKTIFIVYVHFCLSIDAC